MFTEQQILLHFQNN